VTIAHYTLQQRRFGRDRWAQGGAAWLLLRVGRDWMLFTGPVAHDNVGNVCRGELCELAHCHWSGGLVDEELTRCLTMDLGNWNGFQVQKPS